MKAWWVAKIIKGFIFVSVAVLVFGGIVMGLWNALVPELFHGPAITFWQAVGLLILTHLLFRGIGGMGRGHGWHRGKWRQRFEEKLAAMTPEEREKFKEEYRRRCGSWGHRYDTDPEKRTGEQTTI